MIFWGRKTTFTGGKSQIRTWPVSADNVDELERLVDVLKRLPKQLWWGRWPTPDDPWAYNDKRQPIFYLKQDAVDELADMHNGFEVPPNLFAWLVVALRKDLWQEYTDHSAREFSAEPERYFRSKLKWCAGKAAKFGDLYIDPEDYEPEVWCRPRALILGLKTIQQRIDNFDPGHRKRLNKRVIGMVENEEYPANVREYLRLDAAGRRQLLTKMPWLEPVLIGRGLEDQIPSLDI